MKIELRHNIAEVRAQLALAARELEAASFRATNRTAASGRTHSVRELAAQYGGLRIRQLRSRVRFERAARGKSVATLTFSGRRFVLYGNFGMRALGRWGVRFGRLPWKVETISGEAVSAEMLARAFRQRSRRTGRADVFSRRSRARESLEILLAPGVARTFAERGVDKALERFVRERFPVVLRHEARFVLSQRR